MREENEIEIRIPQQRLGLRAAVDRDAVDLQGLRAGFCRRVATGDRPTGVAEMREVRSGGAADLVSAASCRRVDLRQRQQPAGERGGRRRAPASTSKQV